MKTGDFDFELPDDLIALRPVSPRDSARMLIVPEGGPFGDERVTDLEHRLRPGDCLVFNDTKVIPARLFMTRKRGEFEAQVEIMLHRRLSGSDWRAFARPAKRLKPGDVLVAGQGGGLKAQIAGIFDGGEVEIRFDCSGPDLDLAIAETGSLPLPPYISGKRDADEKDETDYQTVYAKHDGAVAAPTAGLHFTDALLNRLKNNGVQFAFLTLHVSAGTFLPVKADDIKDHVMHFEAGVLSEETAAQLESVRRAGGRIVAVGTTAMRLLETAASGDGGIRPFSGETNLFITPGYRFRAVDMLMTNFHLPKSTLFMLVSAFCGQERMKAAYAHAVSERYRFYSYGDSSLLYRNDGS